MKIRIYSTEYLAPLPSFHLGMLLGKLPPAIRHKVERYKRWQDAHGCLFGKLLLMQALHDAGLPGDLNELQYTRYGRPFMPAAPDFNISHSGNRVACIIYIGGRVGIDLEEVRDLPVDAFRTQFSENEWRMIRHSEEPIRAFYHFWTAKESILKADGRGLNIPLADLQIDDRQEIVLDGSRWNIKKVPAFANYICHIAYEGTGARWDLIELPDSHLLQMDRDQACK